MRQTKSYLFLAVVLLLISVWYQHITYGDEKYERIVDSDGKGYYAYLPAIFIYHDLSFGFYFKEENKEIRRYFDERFLTQLGDKTVIKTYCGEALLMLPFFASGCIFQYFIAGHTTGFEPTVQFFICLGALFYLCLGLLALHKLLRSFGFSDKVAFHTSLGLCLGTNLLTYAVFYPTMSHVYSFSMIACFIYLVCKFKQKPESNAWLLLFLLFAIIILIRPVNGVLIVFPLILITREILSFLKNHFRLTIVAFSLFVAVISIQPLLNYIQCRELFPWSYGDEGFYWRHPEYLKVLFSFRNGMFIYSPVLWLVIPGFALLFFRDKLFFLATFITLLLSFYFIAAWWNWSSEPAMGNRSCIDWYAFFALPLAVTISQKSKLLKYLSSGILFLAVSLNGVFTWQYLRDIIHPDGMTKEKFKYVFLKTSKAYYSCLGNGNEESFLPAENAPFFNYSSFDSSINNITVFNDSVRNGMNITIENNSGILKPMKAVVRLQRLEKEFKACTDAFVFFDYLDKNGNLYYRENLRINDIPRQQLNVWKSFEYTFVMPALKSADDKLIFSIDNSQGRQFEIKDLQVSLFHFAKR